MCYADKEKQKEYNKKYYSENKEKIEALIGKKCECQFCGRSVRWQNLFKHQKSSYCKNRRDFNEMIEKEKNEILENKIMQGTTH